MPESFSLRMLAAGAAALLLASCTTNPYTGERQVSKTAIGAAIGAASGAAIGAASGGDRGKRAAIGAGAGAVAGGAVGGYMDLQEAKLREQLQGTGVSVTRNGDELVLNMPGNVTFDTDHEEIRPEFYEVLNSVVLVLQDAAYNQRLSERRAGSVGSYLSSQGVDRPRIATQGRGEAQPLTSNATPEGRRMNRRVEMRLVPEGV
jgi:outer membrane protein OmpA-like peptidoglycan-associated protein